MRLEDNERKKMLTIFAKNLPTYRKNMKLSQEEFGETIGITRQTVSSIERGAYPLTWAIFLSCLFICTGQPRARKLILNSYAGEPVLLGFLNELVGDKGNLAAEGGKGTARQVYYGTCTIKGDDAYTIVDCDAGVSEMLGLSEEGEGGRRTRSHANMTFGSYLDYVHPDDREAIRRILDEKIRKQMVVCIEHRMISAEGRAIPVQCFVRRQKKMMKNGLFDVTITQITGEMLRKRQVSGLLETLPVGVAVFEFQGRIARDNVPEVIYANDVFYDIIGHTKDEFTQIHDNFLPAIVAAEDNKAVMRLFDSRLETNAVSAAEFRVNRFDGSVAWVHCNALVVWHTDDGRSLVSCVLTDITQRINAELSMKHQLDRYRQLEDVSDDVQFSYDVKEDRLSLPSRISEQFGRESMIANLLAGDLPREFCHPEDYEQFMELMRNALGGTNGKGEFRIKLDAKEFKWCKVNMIGIKDANDVVIYIYGRLTVIDEERRRQKERSNDRMIINRLNSTDRLTNLYNRTAFRGRVQEVLADPEMDPVHAIIYCDINDFSYINEKFGYPAGDRILKDFGSMFLRKGKRCFACRIHSDYFLIYVNGQTEDQVIAKLRSWSKVFVEHQSKVYPGIDIQLTNGVYFLRRGEHDIALAMDNANLARKQAKAEQNSLYCICTDELRAKRSYEQTIAGEIQTAIRDNKIEVFLLPKFSLEGRKVIGAEALARWVNDDGTYRSPADFVPILEKTGHIADLDFCIYTNVLQTLRNWKKKGIPMIPISVNFSKHNAGFAKFDERISRLAEQYGVEGKFLELEVNEAMLAADQSSASSSIKDLQRRGFTITLDDFGSGNESLSMLITAPVDHVKISRNFLKNIGTSKTEQEYVRCMCDMIASVHKEAVFEGVETEEQAEFLHSCGFTTAQGYLFERPMPIAEFEKKYLAKKA